MQVVLVKPSPGVGSTLASSHLAARSSDLLHSRRTTGVVHEGSGGAPHSASCCERHTAASEDSCRSHLRTGI